MTKKENTFLLSLIKKGLKEFPKVLALKKKAYLEKEKRLKAFKPLSKSLQMQLRQIENQEKPAHPWRLCPLGQYYRKQHSQKAYSRSTGISVQGSQHPNECVKNKTGRDQLYADEIQKIAEKHFGSLDKLSNFELVLPYPRGSDFDANIVGWTKYWNEVLQPNTLLDPLLVKALIATESSFEVAASNGKRGLKRARGLMQVTDESVKLLSNRGKELKDHFVNLKEDDMLDPNLTICAGIRWLFRKREIGQVRFKSISWLDVIRLYKNYPSLEDKQMKKLNVLYESLKKNNQ